MHALLAALQMAAPVVDVNTWANIAKFKETAYTAVPVTDKVTGSRWNAVDGDAIGRGHRYHIMYGTFLMPLRSANRTTRLFEIGLGCDMKYGPGTSARLWRSLLPETELWEADVNGRCVEKHRESLLQLGIHALVGNQSDSTVLREWMRQSGGEFDAIIDDGGHKNSMILGTFDVLWPFVKPGGVYFIEDLSVGRLSGWEDTNGAMVVSDVIQAWTEQLLIATHFNRKHDSAHSVHWDANAANRNALRAKQQHPLPNNVAFIFCQAEACAIGREGELEQV